MRVWRGGETWIINEEKRKKRTKICHAKSWYHGHWPWNEHRYDFFAFQLMNRLLKFEYMSIFNDWKDDEYSLMRSENISSLEMFVNLSNWKHFDVSLLKNIHKLSEYYVSISISSLRDIFPLIVCDCTIDINSHNRVTLTFIDAWLSFTLYLS